MARKRANSEMNLGTKIGLILLGLAALLTLLQVVFKTCFDIDLGITFFGREIF